eukprot:GHVT01075942.1.p2 GENE.GHVT01075942.1~~GHVT01075942.1.p2  ORF type:complete len:126 (-),score=25.38 GHVT01075942.1:58-435(-)
MYSQAGSIPRTPSVTAGRAPPSLLKTRKGNPTPRRRRSISSCTSRSSSSSSGSRLSIHFSCHAMAILQFFSCEDECGGVCESLPMDIAVEGCCRRRSLLVVLEGPGAACYVQTETTNSDLPLVSM